MHIYIFDYFLNQKGYEAVVAKIETRLTDLGLNGKNCHVGPLTSLKSIVKEEIKNNPKTIVAIGNNSTLNQLINALEGNNVTIGIIPVGGNNSIAQCFGVADEEQACTVLSARLVETVSLGKINEQCFISSAQITNKETILEINGKYTIEPAGPGLTKIINLNADAASPKSNPQDGLLEIVMSVTKKGFISNSTDVSFIQTSRLIANNLMHKNFLIDNAVEIATPAEITVVKRALQIIVGKNRAF